MGWWWEEVLSTSKHWANTSHHHPWFGMGITPTSLSSSTLCALIWPSSYVECTRTGEEHVLVHSDSVFPSVTWMVECFRLSCTRTLQEQWKYTMHCSLIPLLPMQTSSARDCFCHSRCRWKQDKHVKICFLCAEKVVATELLSPSGTGPHDAAEHTAAEPCPAQGFAPARRISATQWAAPGTGASGCACVYTHTNT